MFEVNISFGPLGNLATHSWGTKQYEIQSPQMDNQGIEQILKLSQIFTEKRVDYRLNNLKPNDFYPKIYPFKEFFDNLFRLLFK